MTGGCYSLISVSFPHQLKKTTMSKNKPKLIGDKGEDSVNFFIFILLKENIFTFYSGLMSERMLNRNSSADGTQFNLNLHHHYIIK